MRKLLNLKKLDLTSRNINFILFLLKKTIFFLSTRYDFKVEQNVIAKNPEGEITPISELANFIPFVSGVATIKTNQSQVKIINRHGLMQFFENETHFASIDTGVSLHSHKCLAPIFDKVYILSIYFTFFSKVIFFHRHLFLFFLPLLELLFWEPVMDLMQKGILLDLLFGLMEEV